MSDYQRIAKVIEHLTENRRAQPSLEDLARLVDLSPTHFQKLFSRWAGVSPKKFLQVLTVEAVRERLRGGQTVLDTAFDEGLSGPGRLHDLTVSLEAATPGEIKSGGLGLTLTAGFAPSPFGDCFLARSPRGICRLEFVSTPQRTAFEQELRTEWPQAKVCWDDAQAESIAQGVFRRPTGDGVSRQLTCFVRGSQFQVRVWRALLAIPRGQLTTYGRIAAAIGKPTASRAVGTAIGRNPIGYLIPCHRVICTTGVIGQYRWGNARKQAVVAREMLELDQAAD